MAKKKNKINVKFLEREDANVVFHEIYSSSNVTEFCMLDEDYKAIHPQIRCKDYLQDLFWVVRQKELKSGVVYGFNAFSFLKYPLIDRDIYRVGIRFRTEGQVFETVEDKHLHSMRSVLNQLEDILEFPTSNVFVDESEKIIVCEFDKEWVKYPYLLSLYLLLIRILSREKVEVLQKIKDIKKYLLEYPAKHSGNDAMNLKKGSFILNKIFEKEFPEQPWDFYKNLYDIHDNSGIATYSSYLNTLKQQQDAKKLIPA